MIIYDAVLEGYDYSESEAIDYAKGMVWSEVETIETSKYIYSNEVWTGEGVTLWYCYGGDYYWFSEA